MPDTLPQLLSRAAAAHAGRPAVLGAGGEWTYAELERRVAAFAALAQAEGLAGRRVGLLLPNLPAFPVAFQGLLRARCSAVMLNPLYSPREVREYLADSGARDVVTVQALEGLLPAGVRAVRMDDPDTPRVLGTRQGEPTLVPEAEDEAGREAAVIYTSATDGWARGARLTHRNLAANLRSTVEAMGVGPGDRVVALLPLVHAFGLTVTLNAPLASGGAMVPVERFHPVRLLDLLEESGATVLCGVPAIFLALLAAAERRETPAHSLRLALCGGAPLPEDVGKRFEDAFGLPLRQGYGLTEASPVCLFNHVDRPNRPGTMGWPFPGVRVTIRSPAGDVLPRGIPGEICVEGENVFAGYVGDPGRDPAQFHGQALRTGDLGVEEEDGAVRFGGFLKRMFTRNGFNVYPREIERVVEEDPRVAQAHVTAEPDPVRENEVVLHVVPAPGAELDEEAVRDLCRDRLAAYKQPGRVVISPA